MSPAFFVEEIRKSLIEKYGEKKIYKQGYYIKTSLDKKIQKVATSALNKNLIKYSKRHGWIGPIYKKYTEKKFLELIKKGDHKSNKFKLAMILSLENNRAKILTENEKKGFISFSNVKWAKKRITLDLHKGYPKNITDVFKEGDVVYVKKINKTDLWSLEQIPRVNGAVVVMNPWSGRVLALSGGFDFSINQFNRATQAERQPGSAFKPFVYAAALDSGFTPASLVLDAPFVMEQGNDKGLWKPENYARRFYGLSTLRLGMEKSRNLMTVRMAQEIGMEKITNYAKRFNINRTMPRVLAMALGAGETSLMRLTTAYAMLVNGGKRVEPIFIDRVQDRYGKTLFRKDQRNCIGCNVEMFDAQVAPDLPDMREQVLSPQTAYQVVSMLEGAVTRGTGRRISSIGKPLAGKTGTTNDSRDAWFVGFSADLVAGVYVGYDDNRPLGNGESGGRVAAPIFKEFMEQALTDMATPPFRVPPRVNLVRINAKTGKLARPEDETVILEAFKLWGVKPYK